MEGERFLGRKNTWPVFFLLEKNLLTYSHPNSDSGGILGLEHPHFKGEETETQSG